MQEVSCKCFAIKWSSTLGRHLVASRKILPGEVIIEEEALVQGPSPTLSTQGTGSVCLVCYAPYIPSGGTECYKCKLVLCSSSCTGSIAHVQECQLFQKLPQLPSILHENSHLYQFVNVVRCLLARAQDPGKWKQITELQSNAPEVEQPLSKAFRLLTWDIIFGPEFLDKDFAGSDIQEQAVKCLGALRTNSFSELRKDKSVENLYFFGSLMAHSCYMNTDRQFGPFSSCVIVKAARTIAPGEPITNSYLPFLCSSSERFRQLSSTSWGFSCTCCRCQDPTEFGTFFSALQCPLCQDLSLVPKNAADWCCISCGKTVQDTAEVFSKFKNAEAELQRMDNGQLLVWMEQIEKETWLGKNHAIIAQAKFQACQIQADDQSEAELSKKLAYAEDVLSVLEKLFPGKFMFKGRIRFHRWLGLRELEHLKSGSAADQGEIKLRQFANDAYEILRFGIPGSVELKMASVLLEEYGEILETCDTDN